MDMLRGLASRLLDVVFPRFCACCRADLAHEQPDPMCRTCLARLTPTARPLRRCDSLVVWGVYEYRTPIPELVHAFKYRSRLSVGETLGEWMAGFLPLLDIGELDFIVPVPLHPSRLRERGFNQARLLADAVSRRAGVPVADCLERVRKTAPQWRLGKDARSENVRRAFQFAPRPTLPSLKGARVLLIDDVCTTGGTLESCANALRSAGAASVE